MKKEEKTRLRREKIIAAALSEFSKKGYEGFVINELCKQDGISKGVLYHNFSGKADLYLACAEESFQKAMMAFVGREEEIPSLQVYMERRHRFYQDYPLHSHIFYEAMIATPTELEDVIAPQKQKFNELNEQVCLKLLSEATLKPGLDEKQALAYLNLIQDMFRSYYLSMSSDYSLAKLAHQYQDQLVKVLELMIYGIFEE